MLQIPNSKLTEEAYLKCESLEKIFNGSILVYTMNNKKKMEARNKISRANSLWDNQVREDNDLQLKRPKEESAVTIAQIVMVADDAPEEFKKMVGRCVMINGLVGKTYWLSKTEIEELTWIDHTAIYGLVKEDE